MADALLGKDLQTGQPVRLDEEARRQGLYMIGGTGTGKTSVLLNLILHDIETGNGACVLDPHGDLIDDVLARLPAEREGDVVLLDVGESTYPFGLNLFETVPSSSIALRARTADQAVEVFKKVWGDSSWGPLLEDLLRNIAYTLLDNPEMTMAEIPSLLRDDLFRSRLVRNVTNRGVRQFWQDEYDPMRPHEQRQHSSSTMNKVRAFLLNPLLCNIVGQSKSSVDYRGAMDAGQVVLVKLALGTVGENIVNLLGSIVVAQIFNAALSRQDIDPVLRRPFSLFADEYHRFSTPYFAQLLTDARKYGIATTVAHQFRGQFHPDDVNRGATLGAANLMVFRLNAQDARELAGQFSTSSSPTEPTTEMMTEPAMETWTELEWTPPEAQQEHQALSAELSLIDGQFDILLGIEGLPYPGLSDLNVLSDELTKKIAAFRNPDLQGPFAKGNPWNIYAMFNPCIRSDAVRQCLDSIALVQHSGQPRVRGRVQYSLPEWIPTQLEDWLNVLAATARKDWEVRSQGQAAEVLLSEIQPLLTSLKRSATYWFDSDPVPKNSGPIGSRRVEDDFYPRQFNHMEPTFDTIKYPNWEYSPFPQALEWYIQKLQQLLQRAAEVKARLEFLRTCQRTVKKSRYLGYELPVKDLQRLGGDIQRYRIRPGTPRLRNDVEAEVANEIVLLDDYRAVARIKRDGHIEEHRIHTIQPSPVGDSQAASETIKRIKQKSQEYGRYYLDIENECVARVQIDDESHKTSRTTQL